MDSFESNDELFLCGKKILHPIFNDLVKRKMVVSFYSISLFYYVCLHLGLFILFARDLRAHK